MSSKRVFLILLLTSAVALVAGSSLPFTSTGAFEVPLAPAETWTFQGRVYEGVTGSEPPTAAPIEGAVVSVFGAFNPYPDSGVFIRSTTTDAAGWYGLNVYDDDGPFEFYHIRQSPVAGYTAVGATSVGGTVRTNSWTEYVIPLSGKTLTGNKFWNQPTSADPDLTVTDIWSEGEAVCYQLANVGSAEAAAGHETRLEVDSVERATQIVGVALAPGERWSGCFEYAWSCAPPEDVFTVTADYTDAVDESDETNNTRVEIWICDQMAPEIVAGPELLEVHPDAALIFWETDEAANSTVGFGPLSGRFDREITATAMITTHIVALPDLAPSTTYQYTVRSADAAGNAAHSGVRSFQTTAAPDGEDPMVTLDDPGLVRGTVTITATASDDTGVEKVLFYLGPRLVHTDFSPPFAFALDSTAYANGPHALTARASDLAGRWDEHTRTVDVSNVRDIHAPTVTITAPAAGATVSGKVPVTATLQDDVGVAMAYFKVDGAWQAHEPLPSHPTSTVVRFDWDTTGLTPGAHTVGVEVYDVDQPYAKWASATRGVTVVAAAPVKPPKLKVARTVTRYENYFAVSLAVSNVGGQTATNVVIQDFLHGFQPISDGMQTPVKADYSAEYDAYKREWQVRITSQDNIPATSSRTYTYFAVPVLYDTNQPKPEIGTLTGLHYDKDAFGMTIHDWVAAPAPQVMSGGAWKTVAQATDEALAAADYLIVTHPVKLFAFGSTQTQAVYDLLSDMAALARHKKGVLGFLSTSDVYAVRKLLKPSGSWGSKLSPTYAKALGGYVLLVGEAEIIGAWKTRFGTVHYSDEPYAGDQAPERVVGRIVGNSPANLSRVIRASIGVEEGWTGYGFDRSHAFLVSGTGTGTDRFVSNVNDMASILSKSGVTVDKLHWSTVPSPIVQRSEFKNRVTDSDIVVFRDHANVDQWDDFKTEDVMGTRTNPPGEPAVDLGNTTPVVVSLACLAGNYENHRVHMGGDFNIVEAFFERGAGVYIGATEVSSRSKNNAMGRSFFKSWWPSTSTVGKAFTGLERYNWPYFASWTAKYNIYGDPKFGAVGTTVAAADTPAPAAPTRPRELMPVTVPDYEVLSEAGVDYVTIPGGGMLLQEGVPEIPTYAVAVDYAAGYRVQEVALIGRTGVMTETGLHLPITSVATDTVPGEIRLAPASMDGDWLPEGDFEWDLLENADGTTTLLITIYPFTYNPLTAEATFYNDFAFEIPHTVSEVGFTEVSASQNAIDPGETLGVDVVLHNGGGERDVVVEAVIKQHNTEEVVDGLLLRTLSAISGTVSFAPQWDSAGAPPDLYVVEATLRDGSGELLDRQTDLFNLGIASVEIGHFEATPERFDPGEGVALSLAADNSGSIVISGTVVFEVQSRSGETVARFDFPFADLPPGADIQINEVWDTSGAGLGPYTIVAYVLYDSTASDPRVAIVHAGQRVFLPLVLATFQEAAEPPGR